MCFHSWRSHQIQNKDGARLSYRMSATGGHAKATSREADRLDYFPFRLSFHLSPRQTRPQPIADSIKSSCMRSFDHDIGKFWSSHFSSLAYVCRYFVCVCGRIYQNFLHILTFSHFNALYFYFVQTQLGCHWHFSPDRSNEMAVGCGRWWRTTGSPTTSCPGRLQYQSAERMRHSCSVKILNNRKWRSGVPLGPQLACTLVRHATSAALVGVGHTSHLSSSLKSTSPVGFLRVVW